MPINQNYPRRKIGLFIFFTMLVSLSILDFKIAIMWKFILVDFSKGSRSSEQRSLMLNRERELVLLGILIDWTSFKS